MALSKRLLATGLIAACFLCGCGRQQNESVQLPEPTQQVTDTGSAEQPQQVTEEGPEEDLIDPPLGEDAVSDDVPVSEVAVGLPLSGLVICLDPGHGVTSASKQERVSPLSSETKPAYVSGASGRNQTEAELNLAVAKLAQSKLEEKGAVVILTRETVEATVSNIERAQIANEANADLCIRIHADGADDSSVSGMSMQIPSGSMLGTPSIEAPSARAADIILQAVTEQTGAKNRGSAKRSDLTGFNWSEVPCILLEMGFLSNPDEDARLEQDEYRQRIASGITEGVCRWAAER